MQSIRDKMRAVIAAVEAAAPAALRGGAFGLGTLPLLFLFLLVQRQIDKRDPKLALAPSYADAFLTFDSELMTRGPGSTSAKDSP